MFDTVRLMREGPGAQRSQVLGRRGVVASSQPLATLAGLKIFMEGGNALDAAVAAALTQNVVEPMSTGVGGDLFILMRVGRTGEVVVLNASGPAPRAATLEEMEKQGHCGAIGSTSIHAATVPGAVDGFHQALSRYGTMGFPEVLRDAIYYAEEGYPVSEVIASGWQRMSKRLAHIPGFREHYSIGSRMPRAGEIFRAPALARSLRLIAEGGCDAFYRGPIAEAIVRYSEEQGGWFTKEDLAGYAASWVQPLETTYRGYRVLVPPPNGHGVTALEMLNILEGFDLRALGHNTPAYLHLCIEAKKLAFADRDAFVADPDMAEVPTEKLVSKGYSTVRRALIDPGRAAADPTPGDPHGSSDTVYVCAADREGNVVSLINSLFDPFGTGHVAGDTGILLHCRGMGFSLERGHPNCVAPGKRPLHTLIPAMMFQGERPVMAFGLVGAHLQPQGLQQIVCNVADFGMSAQEALDMPRYRHLEGLRVALERDISGEAEAGLRAMGHELLDRAEQTFWLYGGAQAAAVDAETGALVGASDSRKDGCALAY